MKAVPTTERSTMPGTMHVSSRRSSARLPERQRLAIHLRDVEQWDIDEIAEVTQSDETSVRMNLSRARRTVREELIKIMNYGVQ